ncbi:MAG: hypothetical protein WC947_10655 [Elusimicrobiota bacterium]
MINSIGANSDVNINQQRLADEALEHRHTVFETKGFKEYTAKDVRKKTLHAVIAVVVGGLAVFSNILSVAAYFGLAKFPVAIPIVAICLIVVLINVRYVELLFLPKNTDTYRYLWGKFVRKSNDDRYVVYEKVAPCIYPNCNGDVRIVSAPAREKHNHPIVGICSIGEREHTYTVDSNGIGFPHRFDWRPIESSQSD